MLMSGVSGEGVPEVLRALKARIDRRRAAAAAAGREAEPWRP